MAEDELHYPNLENCSIIAAPSVNIQDSPPSVSLPPNCRELMNAPLPKLYDFHVEKEVLNKKKALDEVEASTFGTVAQIGRGSNRSSVSSIGSLPNLTPNQRDSLLRMKSVTNASDDVCMSILDKQDYSLDASIEAYFRGER